MINKKLTYRSDYNYTSRLERAFQQRIYLIECSAGPTSTSPGDGEEDRVNSENRQMYSFEVMGNSNKPYLVKIQEGAKMSCSCPDHSANSKLCKHMLFVLIRILGISREKVYSDYFLLLRDSKRAFDVSFETIETCSKFMKKRELMIADNVFKECDNVGVMQKHIGDEDACPICLEEFSSTNEKIDWCKGQCGNNVHHSCFIKWSSKQKDVSCVYCRSAWVW